MAKGEWKATTALIDSALHILAEQNPMTIRQLFYRLVSVHAVPNDLPSYQMVSRVMTKCRDDGRCPFDWIADRSRPVYRPDCFLDATEYADTVRGGYRKNYWATQPEHVELWVEKDAIIGSIDQTADELGITIRVGRGYWSTTAAHAIAQRFSVIEKPITVFYLGDHDPSGQDIQRDLYERIIGYESGPFTLERLAIHKTDIAEFELPTLPIKTKTGGAYKDPRAAGFVSAHGTECVELDALPPVELRRRIELAVKGHIDETAWKTAAEIEVREKGRIADAVNQWSSMTDGDAPTWASFLSLREDNPTLFWLLAQDSEHAELAGEWFGDLPRGGSGGAVAHTAEVFGSRTSHAC